MQNIHLKVQITKYQLFRVFCITIYLFFIIYNLSIRNFIYLLLFNKLSFNNTQLRTQLYLFIIYLYLLALFLRSF